MSDVQINKISYPQIYDQKVTKKKRSNFISSGAFSVSIMFYISMLYNDTGEKRIIEIFAPCLT